MFYWFLKWIAIGPFLRVIFRPGHRGRRERARRGTRDPGQQPPLVRRLAVHAADAAAPGHLRGQGRVLHHARASRAGSRRSSSPAPARCRSTASGVGRRGRAVVGAPDPRRGRPVRHLPRGHPLPRRPALPRQDRRRPAGAGDQGAGDPGRRRRHRRRRAARQEVRQVHPADRALRQAAGLLAATRAWRTTATSCARSPTRSCTRSCGSPARSTSTCTPPRPRSSPPRPRRTRRAAESATPSPRPDCRRTAEAEQKKAS